MALNWVRQAVRLRVAIKNLTDEKYVEPHTFLTGAVAPNRPLSAFATLAVRY